MAKLYEETTDEPLFFCADNGKSFTVENGVGEFKGIKGEYAVQKGRYFIATWKLYMHDLFEIDWHQQSE